MSGQKVCIRALTKQDWNAWRDLWTGYLTYYESTVSHAVYTSTFARLLGDDPQDFTCQIAEIDGSPIGLTHYLFHRHAWKIENTCYLQDLYAHPDVRGKGVGRALINGVYDAADRANAPSVYWMTQDFNAPARRLYDDIGVHTPFIKYSRPDS